MPATRTVRARLELLNMNGDVLTVLDNRIVEGQVNVVTDADVTRSLSVTLFDPEQKLRLDSDAPTDGSLYADRMLRAYYCVLVPSLGWVDVPVFTGPIATLSRDDAVLQVECQGKESLALHPVWNTLTVEKGVKKVDAIRRILRERAGETNFDLPDLPTKLGNHASLTPQPPKPKTVGKGKKQKQVPWKGMNANTPWGLAQDIADSMSRQLFYDGMGRCRLRGKAESPLFTFDEALILTVPKVEFDLTEMRNAVRVTGKTLGQGKEKKQQVPTHVVKGEAVAPREHPLSPWRLGRKVGDEIIPRFIPEFVTNDAIRSDQEATKRAKQLLEDRLTQQVDVTFDALPVPHLEELDMIRISYDDLKLSARLREFSLPLTHDGVMSVGYVKRVSKPKRPKR